MPNKPLHMGTGRRGQTRADSKPLARLRGTGSSGCNDAAGTDGSDGKIAFIFIIQSSRMQPYSIACIDVLDTLVQAEICAIAEPEFELRFAALGTHEELVGLVTGADFLLIGPAPVTAALLEHCGSARLIQKYGVGLDKVDAEAARRLRIPLAIAAGSNAAPVSELTLALILAVNRRIVYADRVTRAGAWPRVEMRATCTQLDGKTVGLYGFGAIAQATARRLSGFDVEILYHSRRRADVAIEARLHARFVEFGELLASSDILSIHVPLTPETRARIDAAALARMKPNAIVINTARGGIIDPIALCDALQSGRLRGAGLDVFEPEPPGPDNPLLKLNNVVVMPHAAGGVFDNVRHVMGHALGNMRKVLAGHDLPAADVIIPLSIRHPPSASC